MEAKLGEPLEHERKRSTPLERKEHHHLLAQEQRRIVKDAGSLQSLRRNGHTGPNTVSDVRRATPCLPQAVAGRAEESRQKGGSGHLYRTAAAWALVYVKEPNA